MIKRDWCNGELLGVWFEVVDGDGKAHLIWADFTTKKLKVLEGTKTPWGGIVEVKEAREIGDVEAIGLASLVL